MERPTSTSISDSYTDSRYSSVRQLHQLMARPVCHLMAPKTIGFVVFVCVSFETRCSGCAFVRLHLEAPWGTAQTR